MKLRIGDYEVNISAKSEGCKRANKNDTMSILNFLSVCCIEAAHHYLENGWHVSSNRAKKYGDDIYEALNNAGLYDDLAETP